MSKSLLAISHFRFNGKQLAGRADVFAGGVAIGGICLVATVLGITAATIPFEKAQNVAYICFASQEGSFDAVSLPNEGPRACLVAWMRMGIAVLWTS